MMNPETTPGETNALPEESEKARRINEAYENYVREHSGRRIHGDLKTLLGVLLGSFLFALSIKLFVNNAGILPGGFSGLSILIQRIAKTFYGTDIPFSILSFAFNSIPAWFAFRIIGRKFTLFSVLSIVTMSLLTDLLPPVSITEDRLLMSVFGGILTGAACSLILNCGACTGGTDFIAMCISVKKGITVFNYIMAANWICSWSFVLAQRWEMATSL